MKKLLIIDDDPDILEAVEMVFVSYGYSAAVILKAEEAVAKAKAFQPDLIILDYLLSGIDGADICRDLKAAADSSHIPIIMFSAHPEAHEAATSCGAEDFIAKPFSVPDLMGKVHKLIGAP